MFGSSTVVKGPKVKPRIPPRRNRPKPGAVSTPFASQEASASATKPANETLQSASESQAEVVTSTTSPSQVTRKEDAETRRPNKEAEGEVRGEKDPCELTVLSAEATKSSRKANQASADAGPLSKVSNQSKEKTAQSSDSTSALPAEQLATPAPTSTNVSEPPSGEDIVTGAAATDGPTDNADTVEQPAAVDQSKKRSIRGKAGPAAGVIAPRERGTRAKRKRPTAKDTAAASEGHEEEEPAPPAKKSRKVRKDKGTTRKPKEVTAVASPSAEGDATATATTNSRKRRRTASSRAPSTTQEIDGDENMEAAEVEEEDEDEETSRPKRKRKRKERSPTPEDAEFIEVDIDTVTMDQLTSDRRQGQISSREKAMRNIDWTEVNKRRRERLHNPPARSSRKKTTPPTEEVTTVNENGEEIVTIAPASKGGVKVRMVDGRIVIDDETTTIDRHAAAIAEEEILETVEEDDLTMQINQHSWIYDNRRDPADRRITPNDRWRVADDEKFYEALGMFGTDFGMIAKMFPNRTRTNIKHKFTREERANPELVKAALVGKVKTSLDIKKFLEESERKEEELIDPRKLDAELEAEAAEMQPDIDAARKEHTETERQKRLAGVAASSLQSKAADEGTRRKQQKKKKNAPMGGEVEEIVGSVEDYDIPFPSRRR